MKITKNKINKEKKEEKKKKKAHGSGCVNHRN